MKLMDITFARPYIVFKNAEVSHVTPRKVLIVEWVILELIKRFSKDSSFERIPLSSLLAEPFFISNSDLLAKPCLIELYDLDIIESEEPIDDDIALSDIYLASLSLSDNGKKFLERGLIPGSELSENVSFSYDVLKKKLSLDSIKAKSTTALGISLYDVSEIEFDFNKALEILEEYRGKNRFLWFTSTSEIINIDSGEGTVYWESISDSVEILKDGKVELIKFRDAKEDIISEKEIYEKRLIESLLSDNNYYNSIEFNNFNYNNFDNSILRFISTSQFEDSIKDISKAPFALINSSLLEEGFEFKNKATIYYNSDHFEFSIDDDNNIRLYIEDSMPIEHSFAIDRDNVLCIARFNIYNDYNRGDIILKYFHPKANFEDIVKTLLNKYKFKDARVLLLSYFLVNKASFIEYVSTHFNEITKEEDAFNFLSSLKELSLKLGIGKNNFIDIISNINIYSNIKSIDSIIEFVSTLVRYNLLEKDKTFDFILGIIRKNNIIVNNLREQEKLFSFLNKNGITYNSKIDSIIKNIYKNSVIEMFRIYMNSTTHRFEEISTIERLINSFANNIKSIENILTLKEGDIYNNISTQKLSESIILYYRNLKDKDTLLNNINNIDKTINELCTKLDLNKEVLREEGIYNNTLEEIKKSISIFNDSAINNFKNVYVLDTNILLDCSDIFKYINNNSLLIIPLVVIEELDKLKNDKDENKAFKVREAIRALDSVENKGNIKKADYKEELIPNSFDIKKSDNKILATAMSYISKELYLVTNDINLRNRASSQNIKSLSLEEFIEKNKHNNSNNKKKNK